ncbi:MAG: adenylyltransferase/cytidyltransferase family protein [Verrucomicrobiaceae bacterium]|nr:adenylyltransferase/cytidyltransferase family protein [Verrucomicrobiaceae bacterium]
MTVLTYGTFDHFHWGHLNLLERARALGNRLVVGVVSDQVCSEKNRTFSTPCEERLAVIKALRCVDEAFVQLELDQKEKDIDRFSARYLVVGDDWKGHPRFEQVRGYHGVEIVYLERTPGISSTLIRQRIKDQTPMQT